jgi:hypothetical protein
MATGYELENRVRFPTEQDITLFSPSSRPTLEPTQPPIQWVEGALSPGVKRPGHEADYSPPANAKVKNCEAIPLLPHTSSWCGA